MKSTSLTCNNDVRCGKNPSYDTVNIPKDSCTESSTSDDKTPCYETIPVNN